MKKIMRRLVILFDHNFKNMFLIYIMRKVSLYFILYNGALSLKISKMALNSFCDKTLHFEICMTGKNTTIMCHLKVQSGGGGGSKDQLKYD